MYEFDNLFLSKDGLLCRRIGNHEQVVLPQSLRRLVYRELHENMGHLGGDYKTKTKDQRPEMQDPHLFTTIGSNYS